MIWKDRGWCDQLTTNKFHCSLKFHIMTDVSAEHLKFWLNKWSPTRLTFFSVQAVHRLQIPVCLSTAPCLLCFLFAASKDFAHSKSYRKIISATYVQLPRAGSRVVRIDPLHFLGRCRKRRLNQALPVLSLSLGFFSVSVVLLTRAPFCVVSFRVICICVFYLLVLVRLSVPVLQGIDWKHSSPKWAIMWWWGR